MKAFFILAMLPLAACAAAPASIQPAYVSAVPYESWTCTQLAEESIRVNDALATASRAQEQARGNDAVGVILIGIPVSSLSGGNIAPQIAHLKGQKNAIETTMITKNCSAPAKAS